MMLVKYFHVQFISCLHGLFACFLLLTFCAITMLPVCFRFEHLKYFTEINITWYKHYAVIRLRNLVRHTVLRPILITWRRKNLLSWSGASNICSLY